MANVIYNPWTGQYEDLDNGGNPVSGSGGTTKTPKTALDYINSILGGANKILSSLFPTGLNNTGGSVYYPGSYPQTQQAPQNNNTLLFVLLGFGLLYFLTKDK